MKNIGLLQGSTPHLLARHNEGFIAAQADQLRRPAGLVHNSSD
jgi:hypothetical protein